jgi:hypothetical protein
VEHVGSLTLPQNIIHKSTAGDDSQFDAGLQR